MVLILSRGLRPRLHLGLYRLEKRLCDALRRWFVMHFDDGADDLVQLPDETVCLLEERVERCTCERCISYSDDGCALPLP